MKNVFGVKQFWFYFLLYNFSLDLNKRFVRMFDMKIQGCGVKLGNLY